MKIKVKSAKDLKRFALERGAEANIGGKPFNSSRTLNDRPKREIPVQPEPPKPKVVAPAPRPEPTSAPAMPAAPANSQVISKALAAHRASVLAEVQEILADQGAQPIGSIEITVERAKGLISKIVAVSENEVIEFVPVRGSGRLMERITIHRHRRQ